MRGFGASGPAETLYQHFGITAEAIVAQARSLLDQTVHLTDTPSKPAAAHNPPRH